MLIIGVSICMLIRNLGAISSTVSGTPIGLIVSHRLFIWGTRIWSSHVDMDPLLFLAFRKIAVGHSTGLCSRPVGWWTFWLADFWAVLVVKLFYYFFSCFTHFPKETRRMFLWRCSFAFFVCVWSKVVLWKII